MAKMFFAEDGSWGNADGITIIDTDGLDNHFDEYIDSIREYDLAEWSAWFVKNNHAEPLEFDGECQYCENFAIGSLAEIDKALADE